MISLGREPQEDDHSKRNLAAERRQMPGRDIYAALEHVVRRQRARAGCIPPLQIICAGFAPHPCLYTHQISGRR